MPAAVSLNSAGHSGGNPAAIRRGTHIPAPIYLAACILSLLPFFWVEHPAVVDFANHAARMFLACQAADPVVASMYDYRLAIIPNLALDLINQPLCGVVAPTMVVKLATAGALLGIYLAGWLIQRRLHGRANIFLLLLPAMSLNLVTTMGYTNYLAGIAIAFFVLLAMIGRREDKLFLLLVGNVGGTLAFFSHIFAFLFLLIAASGILLQRLPRTPADVIKVALQTGAMFLLPLALIPFVPSDGEPLALNYASKVRLLVALFQQQEALFIFVLILSVPLFGAIREGVLKVHPSLKMALILLALLVLLVPGGIRDAVDVDTRLLVPLAFLFFLSIRPERQERAVTASLALVIVAFFAGQLWALQRSWKPFDRDVAEFRQALGVLPPGATLLSVGEISRRSPGRMPITYAHLASYATLDRRVFNPLEFTGTGMQPLSATARFAAIDTPASMPLDLAVASKLRSPSPDVAQQAEQVDVRFALRWPERFEYVVHYHFGRPGNFAPGLLTELHRGSYFSILKVRRPAGPE